MNSITSETIRNQSNINDLIRRIESNSESVKYNKDLILNNLNDIKTLMNNLIRLNDKNLVNYERNKLL